MNKEEQKKLLIEIMEADEKDGIYKTNNMEFQIVWNVNNPEHPNNNYLCDLGAYGVSLCWWDGEIWTKMWTGDKVKVYGWINIPVYITITSPKIQNK